MRSAPLFLIAAALALEPVSSLHPSAGNIRGRNLRNIHTLSLAGDNTERREPDLSSFFNSEFHSEAKQLSPNRIIEMIPLRSMDREDTEYKPRPKPLRQELFQNPLVSVLYERVLPPLWEAGLRIGGPDAEFGAAAEFLDGAAGGRGRAILDLSCGTGFIARRFASSGKYDRVFALDYSDKMLGELLASLRREEGDRRSEALSIIRGDAGALPFRSESLDAVHWGAAMHCVPSAERALEEVHRVLKAGGKFYATLFLRPFPDVVFRFFTVEEISSLAAGAGFEARDIEVEGRGVYGILRAVK